MSDQPVDYERPGHRMYNQPDNGTTVFKVINGVMIVLVSALMLWTASTLNVLTTQVAVLIAQNEAQTNEFARIDRRITAIERDRRNSPTDGN